MSKAKEIIFLISMVIVFFAVAAMETENPLICGIIAFVAASVAWVCVDKANATKLRW